MSKYNLFIKEDSVTPWIDKKLQGLEGFEEMLLTVLANAFLEVTDPFVPHEKSSGSLMESAHYMWTWTAPFPAMGLYITWTGIFNTNESEYRRFQNIYWEDYALSVYTGYRYTTGEPVSDGLHHWVDESLEVFDEYEVIEYLDELFTEYLDM